MREFTQFVLRAVRAQVTTRPPREVFVPQFIDAGYGSLMLLTILTIFAGLNLAVQSFGPFSRIGAQDMLGMFAGIGGVRELFPVMAAVVGGARIGANVAASLANMKTAMNNFDIITGAKLPQGPSPAEVEAAKREAEAERERVAAEYRDRPLSLLARLPESTLANIMTLMPTRDALTMSLVEVSLMNLPG